MKNRYKESIKPLIESPKNSAKDIILLSPSDIGVRRNLGRNGTRFGPEVILNTFGKMQNHLKQKELNIVTVSSQQEESVDFAKAQQQESQKIKESIRESSQVIHLGGGHDHVYPLLLALNEKFKKIAIINFDAHCDTRVDCQTHSGTPFRDFDKQCEGEISLLQVGIHKYANSHSTLENLSHIKQKILFKNQHPETDLLNEIQTFIQAHSDAAIVLSVDSDGIAASEMEAVSAVNHDGFSSQLIRNTFHCCLGNQSVSLGFYEYNPLFDNLSNKGAKLIAGLMFDFFVR